MGKKYLIDSNTIEFTGNLLPDSGHKVITGIINDQFNISFINKIEVLEFTSSNIRLQEFIDLANIIGINENIIAKTIELRKTSRIKIPDAIFAATALANNFTLISRNIDAFKNIEGLEIMNPWNIS